MKYLSLIILFIFFGITVFAQRCRLRIALSLSDAFDNVQVSKPGILFFALFLIFFGTTVFAQKYKQEECKQFHEDWTKAVAIVKDLQKKNEDLEKENKELKANSTTGNNTALQEQLTKIAEIEKELKELKEKTPAEGGNKAETDKLKAELKQANDALSKKEGEIAKLTAESTQNKTALAKAASEKNELEQKLENSENAANKLKGELSQKDAALTKAQQATTSKEKELEELNQKIKNADALQSENEALKKNLFADLDKEINVLIVRTDFTAAAPKIEVLNKQIDGLKAVNKSYVNSLDGYSKKIQWFQSLMDAINNSKTVLDEKYDLKKVETSINDLKMLQSSAAFTAKPTADQAKLLEAQIALLNDYCGRHNYVCNKLADADGFGADKVGALEEIDAARKRVDAGYTFLVKTLENRRKSPTNKSINLERVACP